MTGLSSTHQDTTIRSPSGLVLDVAARPDSPILTAFYSGYDRAFVLPDEKEDLDGFRACLALGDGPERERLIQLYGPHREVVLTARDPDTGQTIGGANFIAYPLYRAETEAPVIAGNLNYIFVDQEARGKGAFRKLATACRDLQRDLFAEFHPSGVLTFIELNDPLALSDEDYALDSERSGLDQFDRLAIWSRVGAKLVDFGYVQPPLSQNQKVEEGLLCGVLGAEGISSLDPALLHGHFQRFFGISVLKGIDPERVPSAAMQLRLLEDMTRRGETVRLFPLDKAIAEGRKLRSLPVGDRPAGFRRVATRLE